MPRFKKTHTEAHLTFFRKLTKMLWKYFSDYKFEKRMTIMTELFIELLGYFKPEQLKPLLRLVPESIKGNYKELESKNGEYFANFTVALKMIQEAMFSIVNTNKIDADLNEYAKQIHRLIIQKYYEAKQKYDDLTLSDYFENSSQYGIDASIGKMSLLCYKLVESVIKNKEQMFDECMDMLIESAKMDERHMEMHPCVDDVKITSFMNTMFYSSENYDKADIHDRLEKHFGIKHIDQTEIPEIVRGFFQIEDYDDDKVIIQKRFVSRTVAVAMYAYALLADMVALKTRNEMIDSAAGQSMQRQLMRMEKLYNETVEHFTKRIKELGQKLSKMRRELKKKNYSPETAEFLDQIEELENENELLKEQIESMEEQNKTVLERLSALEELNKALDLKPFDKPIYVNYFGLEQDLPNKLLNYNVIVNMYDPFSPPNDIKDAQLNVLNISRASHKVWMKLKSFGITPEVVASKNTDILAREIVYFLKRHF